MEVARRVLQLDAIHLQEELTDSFFRQCLQCCKYCFTEGIARFKPEVKAALQCLLMHQSLLANGATFPQSMLGLRFTYRGRWRVIAFILLYVASRWYRDREDLMNRSLARVIGVNHWTLKKISSLIEATLKLFALWNFVLFLVRGRYPTILERILGLHMVPSRPAGLQEPSTEYTNREELWHGFTEFVTCVLPFVNVVALKNWTVHTLIHYLPRLKPALVSNEVGVSLCAVCGDAPTLPHLGSCGHVFCYYCISANKMADANFKCNVCESIVVSYKFMAVSSDQ
jgi:peroxin-2